MQGEGSGSRGSLTLGEYMHVLWRWKWMIIVIICSATLGAYFYSKRQPLQYQATAELIYVSPINAANPLGSSFTLDAQNAAVQNAVYILGTNAIKSSANSMLKLGSENKYSVTSSVQGATTSSQGGVIDVIATSGKPGTAAAVATAYAQALIDWSKQQQLAQIVAAERAIEASLAGYTTSASRTSAGYIVLQQNLQSLTLLQVTASGNFNLISPAVAPSSPSAPKPLESAAIGLSVGLLVSVGLAFLVEQLDTRVRDEQQIAEVLGLTVLGHIPPLTRSNRESGALHMLNEPTGPSAEAVRVLRGNLDFMGVDADIRSLVISSSVHSEGKSIIVCNLAASMALVGKRVVLVDADLRRPRVHTYVGVPNGVGLSSVIARHVALDDALISLPLEGDGRQSVATVTMASPFVAGAVASSGGRGRNATEAETEEGISWMDDVVDSPELKVLASGPLPPNPGEMVASRRFGEIIDELSADADLVLIDAPAMLAVGDLAAIAAKVDALVYVVNPARVKRPILHQAHAQLAKLPCRKLGLVVVSDKREHSYYGYYRHPD